MAAWPQSHCPHGAHMCVRHHLLWISVVWECLWVDPTSHIFFNILLFTEKNANFSHLFVYL